MTIKLSGSEDLRTRMLHGEREALAELFAEHRDRLWRIVHFRLDSRLAARVDPDDVLQDAFLDASLRLSHYTEQKQFSPFVWLRMIVGQTLIDIHRRHLHAQQRDVRREATAVKCGFPQATSVSLTACLMASMTSPSQQVMRTEQGKRLRESIESMDPMDREVLALRHFEELSNKEVAEVLGIQQKAASIRYVRAISRLKRALETLPAFSESVAF